jgi:hypothetical protein
MSPRWRVKSKPLGIARASTCSVVSPRLGLVSPIAKKRSGSPLLRAVQNRPAAVGSAVSWYV